METALSVNGVPVRLTYERWYHILENRDELASCFDDVLGVIENPEIVVRGNGGALKAAQNIALRKWLVVVSRELSRNDGFVITAYLHDAKPKGEVIWRRQ